MKIITFENNYAAYNKATGRTLDNQTTPDVLIKPDSALLKDGKPFFIPDFSEAFTFGAALVVRIGRLGKSIPERFAYRYIEAVTVGVSITAQTMRENYMAHQQPQDLSYAFDGSAVVGRFVGTAETGVHPARFRLEVDGATVQQGDSREMLLSPDKLVAYASRFFQLRQGDLLFTGMPGAPLPACIDRHVEGYLNGEKLLEFNLK